MQHLMPHTLHFVLHAFFHVLPVVLVFLLAPVWQLSGTCQGHVVLHFFLALLNFGLIRFALVGVTAYHKIVIEKVSQFFFNYFMRWCLIIYALNNPLTHEKNKTVLLMAKNSSLSGI